jgi:2-iminobutanoate/2-iminopropanoate deaminase
MKDVIKTTVLLDNIDDFKEVNVIYETYFSESKPARSCFAVAALPCSAKIEIEVIAEYNS